MKQRSDWSTGVCSRISFLCDALVDMLTWLKGDPGSGSAARSVSIGSGDTVTGQVGARSCRWDCSGQSVENKKDRKQPYVQTNTAITHRHLKHTHTPRASERWSEAVTADKDWR